MKSNIILILVCILLTGCASSHYDLYSSVDQSDKSIALPPGATPVISTIKKQLIADGWKITVLGNSLTSEFNGQQTVTQKNANARYTLYYQAQAVDINILTGEDILNVDASLVDNHSDSEVFAYSARRKEEGDVAREIIALIENKHQ
jgi:hypothetical protein